ncbi:hypothetical protein ZIOFF_035744 [Zingiber officinale]|uniref:Uncharacterized protein n=1 Tax=Zingiber officinale TaxID=94328 RepID=A0A8J5GCZ6_ZINOF|nr:hypothetical protein ZIOFF_035744 [Zingiber officinale]
MVVKNDYARLQGKLDDNARLLDFTEKLEVACVGTVESGKMTKDLALLIHGSCVTREKYLNTEEFIDAVASELRFADNRHRHPSTRAADAEVPSPSPPSSALSSVILEVARVVGQIHQWLEESRAIELVVTENKQHTAPSCGRKSGDRRLHWADGQQSRATASRASRREKPLLSVGRGVARARSLIKPSRRGGARAPMARRVSGGKDGRVEEEECSGLPFPI